MRERGFIKNIVIIIVILVVVFLSQQPYFKPVGENMYATSQSYWSKTVDWFKTNIYPRVSGEVTKRGEPLKQEITNQKNNAVQTLWESIKNYFAEKFSNFFGTKVQ